MGYFGVPNNKKVHKTCLFVLPICPMLQGYPKYVSGTNCQVEWIPLWEVKPLPDTCTCLLIIDTSRLSPSHLPAFVTLLQMVKLINKILSLRILWQVEGYPFFCCKSQVVLKTHTLVWPISGVAGPWVGGTL